MTDEGLDPRFERDLRAVLAETAPVDAPASLHASVADVPRRVHARHGRTRRMAFVVLAAAAVVVIAVAAIAVAWRPLGTMPVTGGPATPGPTPAGQLHLVYRVMANGGVTPGPNDIEAVAAVLAARLDRVGAAESAVGVGSDGSITVDIAVDPSDGATAAELRRLLGATGRLDFVPLGDEPAEPGERLDLAQHPPLFSGDQVASATLGSDQTGTQTVDFTLRPEGARLFADYTEANIGTYFAIALDGVVITAPVILSAIPDGEVQITEGTAGGDPLGETQRLLAILHGGVLPFPVQER